ncbi:MAG: hypothetical protein FWC26_03730 [Fibromonadales bacterium]|nr:hypothetical protein [Fibromonadales bacterium]
MTVTDKIKIKIGIMGYPPFKFNKKFIKKWKSDIFEIVGDIETRRFRKQPSDSGSWRFLEWIKRFMVTREPNNGKKQHSWIYKDSLLEKEFPENRKVDFSIWITYVPIEDNYFVRRLSSNRIVLTYFGMYDILKRGFIPVENLLLRTIYRHILVYMRYDEHIPVHKDKKINFTHDDTHGCIFDMNVNKEDVVFSLDKPTICDECIEQIRIAGVADNSVNQIKKEISRIKKGFLYKITGIIKEKTLVKRNFVFLLIITVLVSTLFGIMINIASNLIWKFLPFIPR